MSTELKENLGSGDTWKRGLFILLFAIIYSVAEVVLWAIVLFQFGSHLIIRRSNESLLEFSRGLNAYFYQILQFISFRSEEKPYPFNDWPSEGIPHDEEQPPVDPPTKLKGPYGHEKDDDEGETETGV